MSDVASEAVGIRLIEEPVRAAVARLVTDAGGDPVREAVIGQIEREAVQAQAQIVRQAIAEIDQALEKRYQFTVTFAGEQVKVFTINGDVARKQVKDGGMGCIDFTMGMNGWAAKDPMYHATGWCFEDEVCLHNLLSAASFLVVMVHEVLERWAIKWLMEDFGMSIEEAYDFAHDHIANPAENLARDWLNAQGFVEAA